MPKPRTFTAFGRVVAFTITGLVFWSVLFWAACAGGAF